MNKELFEAIAILEKEKNISREVLIEAIERSLIQACKIHFGKSDNIKAEVNRETCDFSVCGKDGSGDCGRSGNADFPEGCADSGCALCGG